MVIPLGGFLDCRLLNWKSWSFTSLYVLLGGGFHHLLCIKKRGSKKDIRSHKWKEKNYVPLHTPSLRDLPAILLALHLGTRLWGKYYPAEPFLIVGSSIRRGARVMKKDVLNTSPFIEKVIVLERLCNVIFGKNPKSGALAQQLCRPRKDPRESPKEVPLTWNSR